MEIIFLEGKREGREQFCRPHSLLNSVLWVPESR